MSKISTASRLKELLSITGDTQKELAKKSNLSESAVSHYVVGNREPRQDALYSIASAYGVDPSWLMGMDVPMYSDKQEKSKKFLKNAHLLDKLTQDDLDYLDHQILYMAERRKGNDNQ